MNVQKPKPNKDNYNTELNIDQLVLPPGTQQNKKIHGYLKIQLGNIIYQKNVQQKDQNDDGYQKFEKSKFRIKFWGQQDQVILVAANSAKDLQVFKKSVEYEVRTPLMLFYNYLKDMVKLKIEMLDKRNDKVIGLVFINFLTFLSQNVNERTKKPFDKFSNVFQILKPQNYPDVVQGGKKPMINYSQKIGEIEVTISSEFYDQPKLVFQGLLQEESQKNSQGSGKRSRENGIQEEGEEEESEIEVEKDEKDMTMAEKFEKKQKELETNLLKIQNKNQKLNKLHKEKRDSDDDYEGEDEFLKSKQTLNREKPKVTKSRKQIIMESLKQNQDKENENLNGEKQENILTSKIVESKVEIQNKEEKTLQEYLEEKEKTLMQDKINKMTKNKNDNKGINQKQNYIDENLEFEEEENKINNQFKLSENQNFRKTDFNKTKTEQIQQDIDMADWDLFQLHLDEMELVQGVSNPQEDEDIMANIQQMESKKQLRDVRRMIVKVLTFKLTNNAFRTRFSDKKVFIDCEIPCFSENDQKIIYNRISLAPKSERAQEYTFNYEFPQFLRLTEYNLQKFLEKPIYFKLMLEDSHGDRVKFGQQVFNLQRVVFESQLKGAFKLQIENQDLQKNAKQKQDISLGDLEVHVIFETGQPQKSEDPSEEVQEESFEQEQVGQLFIYVSQVLNGGGVGVKMDPIDKVYLRYRFLTGGEAIESDPFVFSNQGIEHFSVQPLFRQSVLKLQKGPFILELWLKSLTKGNSLLGVCKLNLSQIGKQTLKSGVDKKGQEKWVYSMEEIKNNLNPIILFDQDEQKFESLVAKNSQPVALGYLTVAFGTVSQINRFSQKLNKKRFSQQQGLTQAQLLQRSGTLSPRGGGFTKSPRKEEAQDHSSLQQKINSMNQQQSRKDASNMNLNLATSQDNLGDNLILLPRDTQRSLQSGGGQIRDESLYEIKGEVSASKAFIMIFEQIRRQKRQAQKQLKEFVVRAERQNQKFTVQEFYDFLKQLPILDGKKEVWFEAVLSILDYERTGEITVSDFTGSFSSYLYYEEIIRDQQSGTVKKFQEQMLKKKWTANDLDRIFIRHTEFGFIQKHKFLQLIYTITDNEQLVDQIIYLLDPADEGLIQANQLAEYCRNQKIYDTLQFVSSETNFFSHVVTQNLQEQFFKHSESVKQYLLQSKEMYDKVLTVRQLIEILTQIGLEVTFFEATIIIQAIKDTLKNSLEEGEEYLVSFVAFMDYAMFLIKEKERNAESKQQTIPNSSDFYNAALLNNQYPTPSQQQQQQKIRNNFPLNEQSVEQDEDNQNQVPHYQDDQDDLVEIANMLKQ